jgi:hypothetical protein
VHAYGWLTVPIDFLLPISITWQYKIQTANMTRLIRMRFSHISIRYAASAHYQHDRNSQEAARTEMNVVS